MAGFDLGALYDALDARRQTRQISRTTVAAEVNRHRTFRRSIAASRRRMPSDFDCPSSRRARVLRWDTRAVCGLERSTTRS
jgi:hypothetical protein